MMGLLTAYKGEFTIRKGLSFQRDTPWWSWPQQRIGFVVFSIDLDPGKYSGGVGYGTPLQNSCLENLMDGGAR